MRVVGIIAEYNPFHSGHAYQLEEARRKAGADFAVAVMSPDFVQRGEPAVFDKYARTQMALSQGADLVVELPVCYASGSAEYFAQGAVALLDGLGVVDTLSFGCEEQAGTASLFLETARALCRESDVFRDFLKKKLAGGCTFPKARALALSAHLSRKGLPPLPDGFLEKPNNILGVEYCRAVLRFSARMDILPVARRGSGYHDERIRGPFCSATALRKSIFSKDDSFLSGCVPAGIRGIYEEALPYPVAADDFLPYLAQRLLASDRYDHILDISSDLSNRIRGLRYDCIGRTYEETAGLLVTKQMTRARIRRSLLHLILGIESAQTERFRKNGPVFYARVLGFREEAAPLLHEIKKKGTLPLLTKNADAAGRLDSAGKAMLLQDFGASHLYRAARALKYGTPFRSEYEMSPVILRR